MQWRTSLATCLVALALCATAVSPTWAATDVDAARRRLQDSGRAAGEVEGQRRSEATQDERGGEGEGGLEEELDVEFEGEEGKVSIAGAFVFVTCIFIAMVLLCLVNSKNTDIRDCTWCLISDSMSVFIAVLYYQLMDAAFDAVFGEEEEADDTDAVGRATSAFLHYFVWALLGVLALALVSRQGLGEQGYKAPLYLLSHVLCFAAKECFNTVMHAAPFDDTVALATASIAVVLVIIVGLNCCFRLLLLWVLPHRAAEQKSEGTDVEIDVLSVSVGFALTQLLRFGLFGSVPSRDMLKSSAESPSETPLLLVPALSFGVLAVALDLLQRRVGGRSAVAWAVGAYGKAIAVLTVVWCLLYWADRTVLSVVDSEFIGLVLLAVFFSMAAVIGLHLISLLEKVVGSVRARQIAEMVISGMSWLVALPWEQTCDVAAERLAEDLVETSPVVIRACVSLLASAVVGPAWWWYIVPRTLQEEKKAAGDDANVIPDGGAAAAPQSRPPMPEASGAGAKAEGGAAASENQHPPKVQENGANDVAKGGSAATHTNAPPKAEERGTEVGAKEGVAAAPHPAQPKVEESRAIAGGVVPPSAV